LRHRRLDLVDRGIGDECRIVRLFPDAVVERGDLGRAHLVSHESLGRIRGLLREGGRYDEPGIEAERGRHGGGNHEVATRQVEHGPSPREKYAAGAACADGAKTRGPGALFPAKTVPDRSWGPGR